MNHRDPPRPVCRAALARAANSALESLERRQLMAFAAAVNFQPGSTPVQAEAIADAGNAFAPRAGGYEYGWSRDKTADAIDRAGGSFDKKYDAFVTMNANDRWEMSVPTGKYFVRVIAGDLRSIDAHYAIDVEGTRVIDATPTYASIWLDRGTTVNVTDGRLTIASAPGARNNKINHVEVIQFATTAPEVPKWFRSAGATDTSVSFTWQKVGPAAIGYALEATTDTGATWEILGNIPGNASSYTLGNLSPDKTYYFRVSSYNQAGFSARTGAVSARNEYPAKPLGGVKPTPPTYTPPVNTPPVYTPPVYTPPVYTPPVALPPVQAPAPDPTPAPAWPDRAPVNGGTYFDGVTVNPEYDTTAVANALRPLGINAVRLWGDVEWDRFEQRSWMSRVREYHNLGFHVTLVITDDKVPTYEQARAYFGFAVSQWGMKESIDRWEIVNEPNLRDYWSGTPAQYVNNVLKPAYEVLHAAGETVVGAAVGTYAEDAKNLRDAGYLNYVDYANYHPYGATAAEQIARIEQVKQTYAGKPLTLTEWNVQTWGLNYEQWSAEVDTARNYITRNVESAFYYHFTTNGFTDPYAFLVKEDADKFVPNGRVTAMVDSWTVYPANG